MGETPMLLTMNIDTTLKPADLSKPLARLFELAAKKVRLIDRTWDRVARHAGLHRRRQVHHAAAGRSGRRASSTAARSSPSTRPATASCSSSAGSNTLEHMAPHVTHIGVHDHGFNNLSTYGNLRRLMREGRIEHNEWELHFYEMAIKASGAVQAARWSGVPVTKPSPQSAQLARASATSTPSTARTRCSSTRCGRSASSASPGSSATRSLHENDRKADLLKRLVLHGLATNQYIVFHGDSDHTYDVRGRTAHEAIFNRNDGSFRCRATQQGYSPFSTWTRGLAWAMLGYAEELEFFATIDDAKFEQSVGLKKADVVARLRARRRARRATTTSTTAPPPTASSTGTTARRAWRSSATGAARDADPFNDHEPVDSSASAIAAQGLLRLGNYLGSDAGTTVHAGRPDRRADAARRAVPRDRRQAPGPAAALASTTAPTAGTTSRRGERCPAASRACGATTTCSSWRSTCIASRSGKHYLTFFDNNE